jgi:excisionase family DNA binding protein
MADKVNQGIELQMAVVPQNWLDELTEKLESVKSLLEEKTEEEINSQWVESTVARKLLGVSQKTWQTYRDERRIPFSQFGRKIYVKRADLETFMESHYITARK